MRYSALPHSVVDSVIAFLDEVALTLPREGEDAD